MLIASLTSCDDYTSARGTAKEQSATKRRNAHLVRVCHVTRTQLQFEYDEDRKARENGAEAGTCRLRKSESCCK